MKRLLLLALIVAMPLLAACAGSQPVSASDITNISTGIICKCGCEEILSTCECDDAAEMNSLIKKELSKGQSKEQVIQTLVSRYGTRILPTHSNS